MMFPISSHDGYCFNWFIHMESIRQFWVYIYCQGHGIRDEYPTTFIAVTLREPNVSLWDYFPTLFKCLFPISIWEWAQLPKYLALGLAVHLFMHSSMRWQNGQTLTASKLFPLVSSVLTWIQWGTRSEVLPVKNAPWTPMHLGLTAAVISKVWKGKWRSVLWFCGFPTWQVNSVGPCFHLGVQLPPCSW